ncbi:MAG: cytochrome P450 [Enhygromyxa sp.]
MDVPTQAPFVFDPSTERFALDPYPDYAWLRANAPIYHWRERDALVISRMAELREFFNEPRLSFDVRTWEHYPGDALFEQPRYRAWARVNSAGLFRLSPTDHARVRKLASVALTPRAVRELDDAVQRAVDDSLAQLIADQAEVVNVREFAERIPLRVICDLLGIPDELRASFRRFGIAVIRSVQPYNELEVMNEIADAFTEGVGLLDQVIAERRAMAERPDDLLSRWIEANEDQQRLSDDELIGLVTALIAAGSDTTVHGTCYAVHALLLHRDALGELQADRSLLRGAIEESLRWDGFGKIGLVRYASEAFEFCGTPVRKGQLVAALGGSAARDPDAYEDPDRFDIRRDHLQNLTFGLGRHFCLGANLARSELTRAVETLLLDRFPEAELAGPPSVDPHDPIMRPMTNLPVRLGPDQRSAKGSA